MDEKVLAEKILQSKVHHTYRALRDITHKLTNDLSVLSYRSDDIIDDLPSGAMTPEAAILELKKNADTIHGMLDFLKSYCICYDYSNNKIQEGSLVSMMEVIKGILQERAKNKIKFIIDEIPDTTLQISEYSFCQILLNILDNSLNAIEDLQDPWIQISFLEENEQVVTSITDSGDSFAPEAQEKIFQPFNLRSQNGESDYHKLGLGLFFCKNLVDQSHGKLLLDPDRSSTTLQLIIPKRK